MKSLTLAMPWVEEALCSDGLGSWKWRLCHFESRNGEKNQFFMEILSFSWTFQNTQSLLWGRHWTLLEGQRFGATSATKPKHHLNVAMCLNQPERQAPHQSQGMIMCFLDFLTQLQEIMNLTSFEGKRIHFSCDVVSDTKVPDSSNRIYPVGSPTIQLLKLWTKI